MLIASSKLRGKKVGLFLSRWSGIGDLNEKEKRD